MVCTRMMKISFGGDSHLFLRVIEAGERKDKRPDECLINPGAF